MKKNTKIRITVIVVGLIAAAGCQDTHKQDKQAMRTKWYKTSCEMRLSAAAEQFDAGRYEQAGAVAEECINSDLNLPDAHLLLGKVSLVQKDYHKAKDCFQTYVRLKQTSDEGWFLLALACERLDDNASAFKWYQKALELSPDNVDYIIAVGRMYVAQDDFVSAEKLYLEKIAANPTDTDLKVAAAQMYLANRQNEKAVQLYEQACLIKPENNELLEALGSCYILAGNWQKAHDIYKQLYQRCTDDKERNEYLKIMAFTATNAADYSSAMKYYSLLTAQDERSTQLWLSMGQAALGAGAAEKAFMCGEKMMTLQPGDADATALVGCAKYVGGDYTTAIAEFEKISADDKYGAFSWLMKARCYSRLGEADMAKLAYQKALKMGPASELGKFLARDMEETPPQIEAGSRLTD
jgi:tetratricopeptide (TPR) repeat protein